jgi:general secretion pathway protein G
MAGSFRFNRLFKPLSRRPRRAGYTILELLVVMAILAMLAGLAIPQAVRYFGRAKSDTAQLQVNNLVSAVEMYYLDVGKYPPVNLGLRALVEAPAGEARWQGPYVKKADALTDPWGKPYVYRQPSQHGSFDIYSFGRDGQQGGVGEDKDLTSW